MRYAIARGGPGLPPPAIQRVRLQEVGYGFLIEEEVPTRASQRALTRLLRDLRSGDEVLACSLDVFQMSTGELVTLLRRFATERIKLRLIDAGSGEMDGVPADELLALLAANEVRWPGRVSIAERRRRPVDLTSYQIRYARELRRRGESLRSIGLLFQMSPDELLATLEGDPPPGAAPDGVRGAASPTAPRFLKEADLPSRGASPRPPTAGR